MLYNEHVISIINIKSENKIVSVQVMINIMMQNSDFYVDKVYFTTHRTSSHSYRWLIVATSCRLEAQTKKIAYIQGKITQNSYL